MRITALSIATLAVALCVSTTHAWGHGLSIQVRESQDVVTVAVAPGCAAGISEALSRQPVEGDVPGVEVVHVTRFAVCVLRVDADNGFLEVRDASDEVHKLSMAGAEPPLDRIAAGDTITVTVRRTIALRRMAAPSAEAPTTQP
jgi:hypothetical protein